MAAGREPRRAETVWIRQAYNGRRSVGHLTFDGLGPYDLPDATYADAHKDGDGFMLSFRLWKSENAWTLVRIRVSNEEADKLVRQIGDARVRSDGSTII
jgi:hypothetical protein